MDLQLREAQPVEGVSLHHQCPDEHGADALRDERRPGEHGCRALCGEGCPCNTGNPHFQPDYEDNIQKNITYGGADEEIQRRAGIAQRPQHAAAHVIDHDPQDPIEVNAQIQDRIGHDIIRHADPAQDEGREQYAGKGHDDAGDDDHAHGGMDRIRKACLIARAEITGDHHAGPDRKPHEKADEQIDDR